MNKPTPAQLTVMRFLARNYPLAWLPYDLEQFSPEHPEIITGRQHIPAIRALYRKGWAMPYPKLGKWVCVMTEEGLKAFREATGVSHGSVAAPEGR